MASAKGDKLWRTLPHIVPKNEWEVQLQDVHSHVEGLLRRVHRLEEGGGHASNQLTQLHRKCRVELTSERQLAATASRIDVDVATHRQDLERGLEELRSFVVSQVAAVKADLMLEVEQLKTGLRSANKDIRGLHAASKDAEAKAAATFATKARHEEVAFALKCQHEEAFRAVKAALDELSAGKASRMELEDSHGALTSAHRGLQEEHGQTVQGLERATRALAELEDRTREELSCSVVELRGTLASAQQRIESAAQDRNTLREVLSSVRSQLDETAAVQKTHVEQLREWGTKHNDLDGSVLALQEELRARCDKQDRNLKELDRRERSSWEQFMLDRR